VLRSFAQEKKSDWKALYGLHSGEKIELMETGMKKHVGTFSTVTEEAIRIREGSNDVGIPKENVARVTVLDKSHRFRNSLIFGAVGAGAGAGITAAATRCSSPNNSFSSCDFGRSLAVAGLVGGARCRSRNSESSDNYRAESAKSNTVH